jgi:hypothetical protein
MGQIVDILGFIDYMVPVVSIQLCWDSIYKQYLN